MKSALRVYLHGLAVGEVIRLDDGRIIFDFDDDYVHDAARSFPECAHSRSS